MDIDATAVIDELALMYAQQGKQLAIQRVQLAALRAAQEQAGTPITPAEPVSES